MNKFAVLVVCVVLIAFAESGTKGGDGRKGGGILGGIKGSSRGLFLILFNI
jgi:hypothetical protein